MGWPGATPRTRHWRRPAAENHHEALNATSERTMTPDGQPSLLTRPQSENALQSLEAVERQGHLREDDGGTGCRARREEDRDDRREQANAMRSSEPAQVPVRPASAATSSSTARGVGPAATRSAFTASGRPRRRGGRRRPYSGTSPGETTRPKSATKTARR